MDVQHEQLQTGTVTVSSDQDEIGDFVVIVGHRAAFIQDHTAGQDAFTVIVCTSRPS